MSRTAETPARHWTNALCLNQHWFVNLTHARRIVEAWRLDYNRARPHSSLGYLTPDEFARGED